MSVEIYVPNYILFEDEYILVLNKPHSLMVEPDRNNHPNLLHQVQMYIRRKIYPDANNIYAQHIHRLDRPVSGVILFAKQKKVLKNLSEQFAERKVKKYYTAITEHAPAILNGSLENWLRKEKKKAVVVEEGTPFAEKAILYYQIKALAGNRFLWEIELQTGKFHQIRAQMAHIGCPIIGDSIYGSSVAYKPDSIALHACKLIFSHPITNKEMIIEKEFDWRE